MANNQVAVLLRPMENIFHFLSTPVHSRLFPYPWATTLHAARVSLVYQTLMRRGNHKLNWRTYCAGFLVMSWGGMFSSHMLLSLPPPVIYSIHPWINYLAVHLLLTAFFAVFPETLNSVWLGNEALVPLDGILRTNAITASLSHLSRPGIVSPRLADSPLFHLLLGAGAAGGGGVWATTLNVWSPNWTLSTPVFLRDEAGLWALLDLWGGSIVAFAYGLTSGDLTWEFLSSETSASFYQTEAKAFAGYLFVALFAVKAWVLKLAEKRKKEAEKEKKAS